MIFLLFYYKLSEYSFIRFCKLLLKFLHKKVGENMGRGRPRKFTSDNSTLKLSKADLAKREAEKKAMEDFDELKETAPHWLDHMAKIEYERVVKLMKDKLPVSQLDLTLVATYANLYSQYRKLTRDINKHGTVIIETDEEGNEESRRANPAWNQFLNTQKELRAIAGQLGMSPSSRLGLVTGDEEEEESQFKLMNKRARGS